jgi:hypothetical protein
MFLNGTTNIPDATTIDHLAEAAERKDQRIRAHLPSRETFIADVLERLKDELADDRSPLGDLLDRLHDAPVRDQFDARAVTEMRNPSTLGKAVLALIVQASLDLYDAALEASEEGRF